MPSPFPGMDPYLESLDWFPDLHDITPARKFRILAHTNPTRQRGL